MTPSPSLGPRSDAAEEIPHWTIERMDRFIRALRRTRNVAAAARAAGMSRQAAYKLRARLRGHPFDEAWEAAVGPRDAFRRMIARYDGGDARLHGVTQGDGG